MSRVTKLLLEHGNFVKEKESGSSYYQIAGKKVRLSDHLPPLNVPDELNILIPLNSKKQYIVSYFGSLYVFNSFTELRTFMEHYVIISLGYKKRITCLECATIANLTKQLVEAKSQLNELKQQDKQFIALDSFTKRQQNTIKSFLNSK